jgi:acyl carrier protein
MLMGESVKDRVYEVMGNVFGLPLQDINENSSSDNIGSWDSLKHMDLVMALEEEFAVEIDSDRMIEMMNAKLILLIINELTDKG